MAASRSAEAKTPSEQAVQELREALRGEVISPSDDGYEAARRLWNGVIDKRPALIARCSDVADVISAVRFARDQGLAVAVRGGGHNVAGSAMSDGGLTIDLSQMNSVRVDPVSRTVRAEGGARLVDLDWETQAFGLAVPAGVVSDTGVAGLTLGGGLGWMCRRYGTTSDNLISADIVTADGRLLTVSEDEHPDLFWALRGGGGGLGVVTSFEFRAYPMGPQVFFCAVFYPYSQAREILRSYRRYVDAAPDEMHVLGVFGTIPSSEPFAEAVHGEKFLALVGPYHGSPDEAERAVQPLRELATPLADFSGVMPYVQIQRFFDEDYPSGRRYYWKSLYLKGLSDEVIDALVGHAATCPSPLSTIDLWVLGGAISRGNGKTAFTNRDAPFMLGLESNWDDPSDDERNIAWARAVWTDMRRFSTGGLYVNFPGFEEGGENHRRSAYGGNYERLVALKAKYDPTNLFRMNGDVESGVKPR
jgi:FAD/FMN-containing dehydrogenase